MIKKIQLLEASCEFCPAKIVYQYSVGLLHSPPSNYNESNLPKNWGSVVYSELNQSGYVTQTRYSIICPKCLKKKEELLKGFKIVGTRIGN